MGEKKQGKRGMRPISDAADSARHTVRKNIQIILDLNFPRENYASKSDQLKAAAKQGKVSWSSIQRLLDVKKGKTLDVLADVAFGLRAWPHEILDPKYGERLLAQRKAEAAGTPSAPESSAAQLHRRTS